MTKFETITIFVEIRPNPSAASPNPTYVEDIRRRLRSSGESPTAQVGVVVNELADLLTDTIPRLRELSRGLRNETEDTNRRVRLAFHMSHSDFSVSLNDMPYIFLDFRNKNVCS